MEFGTVAVAVISASLFIGGFIKGAVGFGLPLISTPLMIFFIPLPEAVTINILPVVASNLQQTWMTRHSAAVLRRIWPMIFANAAVLLLGGWVITNIDGGIVHVIIGLLILFHALFSDWKMFNVATRENILGLAFVCGLVSGFLGCVSSFYSFPSNQLLHSMRLRKDEFMLAVGVLMLSGYAILWGGIAASGYAVSESLLLSVYAVAPVMAGMWLGNRARNWLSVAQFQTAVRLMLAATGVALIGRLFL